MCFRSKAFYFPHFEPDVMKTFSHKKIIILFALTQSKILWHQWQNGGKESIYYEIHRFYYIKLTLKSHTGN